MEAAAAGLDIQMEAAAEADEIAKRGMKEAAKESEVKDTATKTAAEATNYVSYSGNSSASTAISTTTYVFARAPPSTSIVLGVARRSGYTCIIIML